MVIWALIDIFRSSLTTGTNCLHNSFFKHAIKAMKRKAEVDEDLSLNGQTSSKKRAIDPNGKSSDFRSGLFDDAVLSDYRKRYANSQP